MPIRRERRHGKTRLIIDIRYVDTDGTHQRYRANAQVQTMVAARAEEQRLWRRIQEHGSLVPSKKAQEQPYTFNDAVQTFNVVAHELRKSTRRGYQRDIETRLVPTLGKHRIDGGHVKAFEAKVKELFGALWQTLPSESRYRNVLIACRSVIKAACEAGDLSEAPKLPKVPRVNQTILEVMSPAQVRDICAKASEPARLAFVLAGYAGLRAGEIRALRVRNVDLGKRRLNIRRSLVLGEEIKPKSGDERSVPIAKPLAKELRRVLKARPNRSDLVAVPKTGEPWSDSGLSQAFRRAADKAGIEGFHYHDLRHFFCTELVSRGVPLPVVQRLAGHRNIQTTMRYVHVVRGAADKAVECLDKDDPLNCDWDPEFFELGSQGDPSIIGNENAGPRPAMSEP